MMPCLLSDVRSMKIGKLGKPVPVKTHSVLTIKLSNGREASPSSSLLDQQCECQGERR